MTWILGKSDKTEEMMLAAERAHSAIAHAVVAACGGCMDAALDDLEDAYRHVQNARNEVLALLSRKQRDAEYSEGRQ